MKYGHKINLQILNYDQKGRGFGEIEIVPGEIRPVTVPFSAKGDLLETTFIKREYGTKICKLDKVIEASPDRIQAPCPHAGVCGGCLWQHLNYQAQLQEKMRGITELFTRLELQDKIQKIIPAEQALGYRNRMDFAIGWNGELGLKEYGSWNRYVDINECLLLPSGVADVLQTVREWMKKHDLQPWDAKFHSGDIRYVVIRDGHGTGQRMVAIIVFDQSRIQEIAKDDLKHSLRSAGGITHLLIGQQNLPADLSFAQTYETVFGQDFLSEKINGLTYLIHPNSFFQTNSSMAAQLQTIVLKAIKAAQPASSSKSKSKEGSRLLDLYCGLGFFGLAAAKAYPELEVHGFELDEQAIKLASQNAEINQVGDRCHFFSGKAENLSWQNLEPDTIILDPPRSGLHPRVLNALLEDTSKQQASSIVYVSCNYHRLEQELPQFLKHYSVESIQPLDLFPQTPHVEVVVTMRRTLRTSRLPML
ncbi:MAG TPA: 23S rRNA (uracil(1939)-C(5))-methyltransferase RlmD [bacterium]|nr:MAG: putative RNA methyltransferase [Parcubacteria group bacterium ADurb.Bin192]HPN15395.1 23S rRNA (uracil(1939)-C(5))-methyltransferase RlmD [bacterium]